ncbi:hypothetical protein FRC09_015752, partial [Ceratobasidium sp. 395]
GQESDEYEGPYQLSDDSTESQKKEKQMKGRRGKERRAEMKRKRVVLARGWPSQKCVQGFKSPYMKSTGCYSRVCLLLVQPQPSPTNLTRSLLFERSVARDEPIAYGRVVCWRNAYGRAAVRETSTKGGLTMFKSKHKHEGGDEAKEVAAASRKVVTHVNAESHEKVKGPLFKDGEEPIFWCDSDKKSRALPSLGSKSG